MAKRRHLRFRLTARRVRLHGILLAVCLWSVYAADLATPGLRDRNGLIKGTDFLHFYTLGTLVLHRQANLLYDIWGQAKLIADSLPQLAGTVFVPLYGPQVSLLFAPFAELPYLWAYAVWASLNCLIYLLCVHAVWKTCPSLREHRWVVLILALAFPGFFHLIIWGQTSGLALACFTLAYLALRARHPFLAGLAIGSLVIKPQLALAAAAVFLFSGEWLVVAGAVLAAAAQLSIGWACYGTQVMLAYFHALLHVGRVMPLLEPRLYQMHSLRAFWSLLVPWSSVALALYLASAVAVLAITIRCWKSAAPLAVRYSALLLASVLVSPHLTVYDVVILAPAFIVLGDAAIRRNDTALSAVPLLTYACCGFFLIGPLASVIRLQPSVIAMCALLLICLAASRHTMDELSGNP
jgi:alpha-1,2-mannosyltransferase